MGDFSALAAGLLSLLLSRAVMAVLPVAMVMPRPAPPAAMRAARIAQRLNGARVLQGPKSCANPATSAAGTASRSQIAARRRRSKRANESFERHSVHRCASLIRERDDERACACMHGPRQTRPSTLASERSNPPEKPLRMSLILACYLRETFKSHSCIPVNGPTFPVSAGWR